MSQPPTPVVTTGGVAADHAAIARTRPGALVATALRTRSVYAREVLAEVAWPGRTPEELDAWAVAANRPGLPDGSDPLGLADYARVVAVQVGSPQDRRVARALLERLAEGEHEPQLTRSHVEMLAHLRVVDGDAAAARALVGDRRIRPDVGAAVLADTLHPTLDRDADPGEWAASFASALHGRDLAPYLAFPPGTVPSLDHLQVEPRPAVDRPERITVMMSTYRPGPELLTAVRSVLGQTWTNLELFVVDDASGPGEGGEFDTLLEEVAGLDPRVRLVRKAVNGGTYRARNTVLRQATGDLAIVIDSDDWWHPQTLEFCAGRLLSRPDLLAVRAQGVRVRPDLQLTRPGYRPRFVSAATVLFRLPEVTARLGYFDPTRKSADTEYTRRLQAAFGNVVLDVPVTTTLLRAGEETLSSDEFGNGWRHPARYEYKNMYGRWHQRIAAGAEDAFLDPERPRQVQEPLRWVRPTHPLLGPDRRLDLVLAGDWRRFGGPQRSMLEELAAARGAGLRVGVMHLEALRFMGTQDGSLCAPILDLIESGEVLWVHPDDDVDVEVLMVRYPPILQYPPLVPRHLRARHVLVMANQAPAERDGRDRRYSVPAVGVRAEELFGRPPRWVPQSPPIRHLLTAQDPTAQLVPWDNPGLIDVDAWQGPPRRPGEGGRPVVIGRHSRDDRIKFPASGRELLEGYTFPEGHEVRVLGGRGTVRSLLAEDQAEQPSNWTVMPMGASPVREFLHDLDFVLYLDHPDAHEAFGRTLLEAAASGRMVVAHPKHRDTFGDLLDYAEPGQAQQVIAAYVADPASYTDRVERTLAMVRERYGHASFVVKLRDLLRDDEGEVTSAAQPSPAGQASGLTLRITRHGHATAVAAEPSLPVVRVPLRAAADAEGGAGLTVVHDSVPDEEIRRWLAPLLPDGVAVQVVPSTLMASAPPGILALVLDRDGLVWVAGRGRLEGVDDDPRLRQLCRAAQPEDSETLPPGWSDSALRLTPGTERDMVVHLEEPH